MIDTGVLKKGKNFYINELIFLRKVQIATIKKIYLTMVTEPVIGLEPLRKSIT
jgi:hypothetical protein